ncbi:NEDD8-like [Daphnia carinata]|uniref:NEDD8-like n=1 Tax=Daphnia carinata TaxID=120202 RepID=UPI00257B862B|nr:NEDD8-like [Daphnia carinata]
MKIIIKPLTGKEFELEVNPECDVEHLKQLIEKKCNMPGAQHQRLVLLGKTLADGSSLSISKLTEGSKIHLFTKKVDDGPKRSGLDIALFNALKSHLTKEEIERVVTEFNKELQTAFTNYSLDDIERLAVNLLR